MRFPRIPVLRFRDPGRVWTATTLFQLVDRAVFLCVWGYLCLSQDVVVKDFVFGRGPWLDIGIYFALTVLQLAFGAKAARRLISETWLEFCGRCIVIGIDTAFLVRLVWARPSEDDIWFGLIIPPYDQISHGLVYVAIVCISLDLLVSASLAVIVLTAVLHELSSNGSWGIWRLDVLVLLGPVESRRGSTARLDRSVFTFKGAGKVALLRLRAFLENHTVYRRNPMVEPAWFAAVRGTVALVALVVTFAFGALNVVVNPTQQFHHPLPRRAIPIPVPYEAGFPDTLNGVIWLKRADYRTLDTETYPIDTFKAAFPDNFTQVFDSLLVHASPPNSTYASRPSSTGPPRLNSTIPCAQYKVWYRYLHTWDMDIGISWTCWGLRHGLAYSMLDSSALSPIIRLNWTGSSVSGPILRGYVTDLPIWEENRLWMESFGSWNVSVGANVRLNLGRRAIYTRPGSFLEMVGFKQKSMEIIGYPVASATFSSMELSSQTIIEISPSFGGFYDNNADAWEEYLEHTVLEGLAATGGLYTAFDLVYALVFGRSIIGILFGGKPLSPFGVLGSASGKILRKRLLLQYPGLETDDAPERSKAVCDFLCDFLLDIGPAQPTRNTQDAVSHYPSNIQLQGIQGGNRIAEPGSERRSREEPRENSTASAA